VESRLSHFRLLKAQKELANGALVSKQTASEKLASIHRAEEMKQKNVEKLMKDFNTLYKEGKYLEAESLAMRAMELDPDNGVASAAVFMARRQRAVTEYQGIKDRRAEFARKGLNDADDPGSVGALDKGVEYDNDRWKVAKNRKGYEPFTLGRPSEKEKAIERQLSAPISISFDNTPLKQVLDELRDYHGINIVDDKQALQEAGVSLESPISIKLDRISLRSALNLILHQVRLTHVIKDEVLMITTEEHARGKLKTVTHSVADLVIPVEDFANVRDPGPQAQPQNPVPNPSPTPVTGSQSMVSGTSVGTPTGGALSSTNGGVTVTKRGPSATTEAELIKLITSTIQPKTWSEMGGPGTIDYFPLTMSLVINQTSDIQEQITDLLAALRRLQDQEVSVEVRFITVAEDFFERIGVNFNMNIVTKNSRFEPMLQTNSFAFDNTNFINKFDPGRFLAGMTPAGTLTPTLDIPINQNSFFQTVPNFGGYNASGLTMGLAFLSEIQVFLFLEAAQGDTRTNVMQAPKLTLFNGQTSTITVTHAQNLVTGVTLAQLTGGQFAILPSITSNPFNSTTLTIQAVISADRRYVRMSLTPTITNLLPGPGGTIATFPIVVPIFTSIEGNQSGQPVLLTQFVQTPNIATVAIRTTVAVPDGGTVLLGGLKALSEARSEYGPPLLSKVPYINRLFKNVGYGRSTESLLIMVTPRIIIQGEEEERQTGFTTPQTGGPGL
jgi:type II secretory pathway component GspD/PulD (secretin)